MNEQLSVEEQGNIVLFCKHHAEFLKFILLPSISNLNFSHSPHGTNVKLAKRALTQKDVILESYRKGLSVIT